MILFFLISYLFVSFGSKRSDRTCLLPFVTKPCINDKQNLSCTFSLNSSERNKTCNLSSFALIFTTLHVELFIIPQYYDQIISINKHYITKLIIEPNISNHTFEYLHWSDIRILSIEIPTNIQKFVLIHDEKILDISRTRNYLNKQYWYLRIWPAKSGRCEKTVFTTDKFTTTLYSCPYFVDNYDIEVCGVSYACFDQKACYNTGYKRLVCRTDRIRPRIQFQGVSTIPQYDTIFISVYQKYGYTIHDIDQETFTNHNNSDKPLFVTKHLVVIINNGILQISPKLFDNPDDFQVRIEHGQCNLEKFQVDILNDTVPSLTSNFIDYTSNRIGAIGCRLNITE